MRSFFKIQPFLSSNLSFNMVRFHSFLSTPSKGFKKTEEIQVKDLGVNGDFRGLFDEITQIIGTESMVSDDNSLRMISSEPHLSNDEVSREVIEDKLWCREGVCENVNEKKLSESEVSSIVDRITEIVRGESGVSTMEKLLEDAGFDLDLEIVDNVLKRCFKVPRLAFRFFNWAKLRDGFRHTTETYNTMIYISGEAKEFELVEELVEEMEKNLCKKNVKTWTILISHYGKAKLFGKALLIFEKMKKSGTEPDEIVYKMMLHSLCISRRPEIAMEFYKEMVKKEMMVDVSLYRLLFKCLAENGDFSLVQLVADDMIKIAQIPEHRVYSWVLKSFCITGRIKEALELIRDLKKTNITLDNEHFENLVNGLCRSNRISDALEIVEIMRKKNVVSEKILGFLVTGYLKKNDISKAFEVFESIKESGFIPTIATYTELIQNLFRLNEFEKAHNLHEEILENGVKLDIVAVTAIVSGYVRQNRVDEAWEILKDMEKKGVKATKKCYTIIMKELCKISRTDEIINVLNEMQAADIQIENELFSLIISYLQKKGQINELNLVKNMQRGYKVYHPQENDLLLNPKQIEKQSLELKSKPISLLQNSHTRSKLKEICAILSSSKDWFEKQEALDKSYADLNFSPEFVVEILQSCSYLQGNSALHFFDWVGKLPEFNHTTETYNMAMKIAGQGKDFKHMRSLFYKMKRKGCVVTSDTWTIMIGQYGQTGLTEIALKIFKEMKSDGCKPRGSTYKSLLTSLCSNKGRKVNEAIQIFNEMIGLKFFPDKELVKFVPDKELVKFVPDKELVEIYLACLCEENKLDIARNCAETLKKFGFSLPLRYSLYIRALCRFGRVDEALEVIDEIGKENNTIALNQYTYGSVIHALLRKRQLEKALTRIESMKNIGINPTVHVYTSLIVYYFKEKKPDKAIEIFDKMKNDGHEPTIVTYSSVLRGYMSNDKISDAYNVFNHMKKNGPSPDFKTYSMFICCLCDAGMSEEALKLISEMSDCGIVPSTVNFRTVFYGLNREGKQDLANSVMHRKLDLKSKRMYSR